MASPPVRCGPMNAKETDGRDGRAGVAVVTGAGSGIGRTVTRELLCGGWSVVLAGRRAQTLEETAEAAAGDLDRADGRVTTGGRGGAVRGGRRALRAGGPAVQQRGYVGPGRGAGGGTAVRGVAARGGHQPQRGVPVRAGGVPADEGADPQGGRIINNGSVSAHVPRPRSVAYTATKHALTGLTKSLALDGRPYRIAVGQIDIGNAATEMTERMQKGCCRRTGRSRRSR